MMKLSIILLVGFLTCGFAPKEEAPKITKLKFGTITVNGKTYDKDLVFDGDEIRERKKGPSKEQRSKYGHTPLTPLEEIPWDCKTLVIGIGMSSRLPVTDAFKKEAKERNVELILLETPEAVEYFMKHYGLEMNAIFHITC